MAIVADSYGAAEEAGGPAQVAGAGVCDVVVATDRLLRQHGYLAGSCAAHDAVSAVGLVSHTGVGAWTHHVGARLCAGMMKDVILAKIKWDAFVHKQYSFCLLLQSPWYMTSRSGCPMQRAISRVHSSLYDFPSLPHTACFRVMWEQSGEHTHWGLPIFILQTFPGLHLTPSQVSTKAQPVVSYVRECQCNVTVLTSLQTSGDPQAFSYKTSSRSGVFPDHNTIFTLHNIYNNHISLLTITHRGVSPDGMWGWRVFITDLCVRLHTDWAKLLQRDGGALR